MDSGQNPQSSAGSIQQGPPPPWAFQGPAIFVDGFSVVRGQQGIGKEVTTTMFLLSCGHPVPPPKGTHAVTLALSPEGAKALYNLLGQNLRDCGMPI